MSYSSLVQHSPGQVAPCRSRLESGCALGASLLALFFWMDPASAQQAPYEAKRHIDAQGIEVIQNRTAEVGKKTDAPRSGQKSSKSGEAKNTIVSAAAGASGAASSAPQTKKIPPRAQSERDSERLEILKQELQTEQLLYERNVALLQTPNIKSVIGEHELQRLNYTLGLHQQNVKSLKAEIVQAEAALLK